MPISVKKIGVSFSGPSIILLYTCSGVTRKRVMPLRDVTRDSDCNALVKRLKLRHSKYLESVSDIRLEKLVLLVRENLRGNDLNVGLENAAKALSVDPEEDLNKLNDTELKRQKQIMDLTFEKNSIGKDHPDYVYDKQVDFKPSGNNADWDSDSENNENSNDDGDEEILDQIEAAPADTNDSDDFW